MVAGEPPLPTATLIAIPDAFLLQTLMFTVGIDVDTQIRAKVAGETYATDIFSVDPLCILEDGELN